MSEDVQVVSLADPEATDRLGELLLPWLVARAQADEQGALVCLGGPLGAGKSALVRAMLRAAGVTGAIPSPTFTLVEPYETASAVFYHLDLYRLGSPEELYMLGYAEMRTRGSVVLVEWAERARSVLVAPALAIDLAYDGQGRQAQIHVDQGPGPRLD